MNWLIAIIICAIIGGIIGYVNSGKKEDAVGGALAGGIGCGYIILQIVLAILGLWITVKIFSWLF
ncbi:hypothetical protein [Pedobacter flavus]|uniref:DUF4190 domain-containing protein n=1 Tax=Pedobacter flavus TaxID=3113906 RepID=A0ABU7GZ63_9SPHI|nr:hypothetical protein [Pedobacter sp. VNH31]MEE1884368.1 hypothetical protein [Pedobacter sp. VNH31]